MRFANQDWIKKFQIDVEAMNWDAWTSNGYGYVGELPDKYEGDEETVNELTIEKGHQMFDDDDSII